MNLVQRGFSTGIVILALLISSVYLLSSGHYLPSPLILAVEVVLIGAAIVASYIS
ncbi:MAG: hypothetical protein JNJ78_23265, partial [Anaerolineae bacterium]|nr:hypothetical protein [Anaerolineae bacterium]